jgi:hypothetical protein
MRRLAGPAVLFLIATGFFWRLLTTQYTWMDHPDMANQILPWYQFQAVSWHRGEFPLWDPHVFGGQPLIGQLQPGAAYPPNWLLFLLPLKDGRISQTALNLYYILTHFFAALFCYWLCRDLGRTVAASVLGGIAFALGGVVASLEWPQMLNGAVWIPLALLFFLRSTRGVRPLANAAYAGAVLGVSFLSGHHQIPTFLALTMAGLWLYEIFRRRMPAVRAAGVFILFSALTSALQTIPGYEYAVRSIRWVGAPNAVFWGQSVPYPVHEHASLLPVGLLGLVLPGANPEVFVGLAVFVLALIGLALAFNTSEVRLLGAIALGGLLLALGGLSVIHGIAYLLVPMVEKARSPYMAMILVQFAMAVLASFGVDSLRIRMLGRWWVPALALAGILPWPVLMVLTIVRPEASLEYERLAIFGVVSLALAALLHAWQRHALSASAAVALFAIVTLFELGTVHGHYRHRDDPGSSLAALQQNRDVVDFLRRQPDLVRVEIGTEGVPYNIGDWDGIDQFRAYLGGMTANLAPFEIDRLNGGRRASRLFALTYFLGPKPIRPDQQLVFQGKSGLNVYRNPEANPLTWTVRDGECPAGDDVRVIERAAARIVLNAHMACPGTVVLSQTHYPGWEARVDGRIVSLLEIDGVIDGVFTDAGAHRIELRYRPASVYWGAALSAVGFAGIGLIAVSPRLFRQFPRFRQVGVGAGLIA